MSAAHTGEGIFFTSKLVDIFRISANNLEWLVDNDLEDNAIGPSDINIRTTVEWKISTTTTTLTNINTSAEVDFMIKRGSG